MSTKPKPRKSDPRCMQCLKRMRRAERIEMGWSVMTGAIAVCSKKCQMAYNTGGRA